MVDSPLEIVRLWKHPDRFRKRLLERSERDVAGVLSEVKKIVSEVRERGSLALMDFTKKYDGVALSREQLRVSEEEISEAYDKIDKEEVETIENSAENIEEFHRAQLPEGWMEEFKPGVQTGQIVRPLNSVGVYAPGGRAQYPSSVLMGVIPAKVADVERIVLSTPPNQSGKVNPATLVASDVAGADEVYKVGGAHAVAAMAYGTREIDRVEKIIGPGNIYVAAAKKVVSSDVDIDFMAGPSEVLILADSTANPRLIALDLIAQSEHDTSSSSVLVTTSESVAEAVRREVNEILKKTKRRRTAERALKRYGHVVIVRSLKRAIKFTNDYAPEHLEIMTKNPEKAMKKIKNVGAIFLGPNSPTAAGDFGTGPNHILPTGGSACCYDGINVYDFLRLPSFQKLSKEGLKELSSTLIKLAEIEGLPAHAESIRERVEED